MGNNDRTDHDGINWADVLGGARSDSGEEDKTFRCVVYLQIGARPFGGRRLRAQNPLRFFGQVLQHDAAPDREPSAQTDTDQYASQ